jgi:hypothetical protein
VKNADQISALETPLIRYGADGDTAPDQPNAEEGGPVAILVCHGMGQQVRYETISAVGLSLLAAAHARDAAIDPVGVHLSKGEDDDFITRAEIKWRDKGDSPHEVHIYEAYWAPLTEGRVTYWDTVKFLLQGGWQGLWYSKAFRRATFQRWMFGGPQDLPIGRLTFIATLGMMLFVLLQIGLIGYVGLDVGHRVLAGIAHPVAAGHRAWLRLGVWLALIAEALFARYFLIQYVGAVAAYISPYKDSKFDQLRHQIQKIGFDIGKAIYGFGPPRSSVPTYSKVVVVGHSLGSVLAYDTLNALINLDNVSAAGAGRGVVHRTRALITFGSPLDKTAFIFRTQSNHPKDQIREQLAASVQPLILSYKLFRPPAFEWVNIWSKRDIISGELNYYDDPDGRAMDRRPIENMIDPEAWVPLFAHTQYWKDKMLAEQLYRCVS